MLVHESRATGKARETVASLLNRKWRQVPPILMFTLWYLSLHFEKEMTRNHHPFFHGLSVVQGNFSKRKLDSTIVTLSHSYSSRSSLSLLPVWIVLLPTKMKRQSKRVNTRKWNRDRWSKLYTVSFCLKTWLLFQYHRSYRTASGYTFKKSSKKYTVQYR